MKQHTKLSIVALAGLLAAAPSAHALILVDQATWIGAVSSYAAVDFSNPASGYPGALNTLGAGDPINLPSGKTLSFNQDVVADSWLWSGGLDADILTTLYGTPDPTQLVASVGAGTTSPADNTLSHFGLEVLPGSYGAITLYFDTTLGVTPGSSQTINFLPYADPQFIGWVDEAVTSFTINIAGTEASLGFAFGNLLEGTGAPPPNSVPDGGSLGFVSALAFGGLLGFARRRRTA